MNLLATFPWYAAVYVGLLIYLAIMVLWMMYLADEDADGPWHTWLTNFFVPGMWFMYAGAWSVRVMEENALWVLDKINKPKKG